MSVILLENKVVHYEVLGRGRPLLFLHGWVGSWRYWVPVMQAVSVSYRAYALDLWGFGDTAKIPQGYTIEQQAALVGDFLEQMGIGKIVIIGHGLGAVVGLLAALHSPERVDRLMLAAYPFGGQVVSPRLRTADAQEMAEWLIGRTWQTQPDFADVLKMDGEALRTSCEDMDHLDLGHRWTGFGKPCLFVYAEDDPLISIPNFTGMPDWSHLIQFEQGGHFLMLQQTSKFNRLVMDFLNLESGVSPQQLQLKEEWKRRVR